MSQPCAHGPRPPQRRSKLTELQTAEMIKTAAQVGGGGGGRAWAGGWVRTCAGRQQSGRQSPAGAASWHGSASRPPRLPRSAPTTRRAGSTAWCRRRCGVGWQRDVAAWGWAGGRWAGRWAGHGRGGAAEPERWGLHLLPCRPPSRPSPAAPCCHRPAPTTGRLRPGPQHEGGAGRAGGRAGGSPAARSRQACWVHRLPLRLSPRCWCCLRAAWVRPNSLAAAAPRCLPLARRALACAWTGGRWTWQRACCPTRASPTASQPTSTPRRGAGGGHGQGQRATRGRSRYNWRGLLLAPSARQPPHPAPHNHPAGHGRLEPARVPLPHRLAAGLLGRGLLRQPAVRAHVW